MVRGCDIGRTFVYRKRPTTDICRDCLLLLRQQRQASAATAFASKPGPVEPISKEDTTISPSTSIRDSYKVRASVLLSRPPILTRDLTPFEKAYFLYQRRLNERLALPFTRYFYYQRGTPGDVEWKRKIKERQTPARDIGVYNAYSKKGRKDELLLGATESEPEEQMEALLRDAEVEVQNPEDGQEVKKEKVERPLPKVTQADESGDRRSLDRALKSSLYLVVKYRGDQRWWFPEGSLEGKESLHTAAERMIVQTGGVNMNTWVVGNVPLGHYVRAYSQAQRDDKKNLGLRGEKVFFMKARIMAGQANLQGALEDLEDFQWLARGEIQTIFQPRDWNAVKNILGER